MLLHSIPVGDKRSQGTIFCSLDDGKSWDAVAKVQTGGFAYSCLVKLPDGEVGCLYEGAGYKEIRFAVIGRRAFDLAK